MKRFVTACFAVILILGNSLPAACARAQAAVPFADMPANERAVLSSHRLATTCFVTGAGLIGLSFVLDRRANQRYDDYLAATDPPVIERLYDETVRLDRWSATSLIGGEALVVTGLYLRFLRHSSRLQLVAGPGRCAASLRF